MQDGIIKGIGNSRYLKTVAEALALYPTYEDFMAAFIAGTLPIDLNGINAAGWDTLPTWLNKANLLTDTTAEKLGLKAAWTKTTVDFSGLSDGDTVLLPEGNQIVEFVVQNNYESALNGAGRVLISRSSPWSEVLVWNSSGVNKYADSTLDKWLNETYKRMFNQKIQDAMGTTKIYSAAGNGDSSVSTIERSCFVPSVTEFGLTHTYAFPIEGTKLVISDGIRPASGIWTRTPYTYGGGTTAVLVTSTSDSTSANVNSVTLTGRAVPCFTLPSTLTLDYWHDQFGNIVFDEPSEDSSATPAMAFEALITLDKVVCGSFTPTASQYPQTNVIDIGFEPDLVIIYIGQNNGNIVGTGGTSNPSAYLSQVPRILTKAHLASNGSINEKGFSCNTTINSIINIFYIAMKLGG